MAILRAQSVSAVGACARMLLRVGLRERVGQWQFWLVLVVAAVMRLTSIAGAPFSVDSASLFLEAARAAHDHVLPGTGIWSSLGTLNMPMYTWLILPIADHPTGMVVLQAVANVAAVGALYVLARRHFGPTVALIAGLLFATSCYDTWLSDRIWQQNIVLPFVVGAMFLAFAGVVAGRRGWFAPHLILVAMAIQIHPVMVSVLVLTAASVVLAWRTVRPVDVALGLAGAGVLFVPTALYEYATNYSDLRVYWHWLRGPKQADAQVFAALRDALGGLPQDFFGNGGSVYAQVTSRLGWLPDALFVLAIISLAWLVAKLVAPLLRAACDGGGRRGMRDVLAGASWRRYLLVVLWPLAFLAITIRHSTLVYPTYVFIVTPSIYLAMGITLADLPGAGTRVIKRAVPRSAALWSMLARPFASGVAGLLVTSQGVVTAAFVLSLATGAGDGAGAISAAGYARLMDQVRTTSTRLGAQQVYIANMRDMPVVGLYWAERENDLAGAGAPSWTTFVADDCALTPAAGATGAVLLVTDDSGLAAREIAHEPATRLITDFVMARDATFPLYSLAPHVIPIQPLATFNGELQLDAASVAAGGDGLPSRLVTHWTVLTSTPPGISVARYHFDLHLSAPGVPSMKLTASCAPSAWAAGEGITLVTEIPPQFAMARGSRLEVSVSRDTHTYYRPTIQLLGGLPLETSVEQYVDPVLLPLGTRQSAGIAHPDQTALDDVTAVVPISRQGNG